MYNIVEKQRKKKKPLNKKITSLSHLKGDKAEAEYVHTGFLFLERFIASYTKVAILRNFQFYENMVSITCFFVFV